MKKFTFIFLFGAFFFGTYAQSYWSLTGNVGTDSTNFIGTTDAQPIIFKTGNMEQMRLLPKKAFLGIGVSKPQATLHLHYKMTIPPTSPQKLLQLTTSATGDGSNKGFYIASNESTKDILLKQQETSKLLIETPGGGIVIDPSGKVGFDTTAPEEKMHLMGKLLIDCSTDTPSSLRFKYLRASQYEHKPDDRGGDVIGYWDICSDTYGLRINTQHDGINTQRVIITENGKVGIGVNTPGTKLDVGGSFKAQRATIDSALTAKALNAQSATISGTAAANTLNVSGIATVTGNTYLNGNVGIGNTNPQAKLDVTGSFKAQSASISGTTTTNTLSAQSATITNALTANALNAQTANITNTLTVNALTAQSANISNTLNAQSATISGVLTAQSINITDHITGTLSINSGTSRLSLGSAAGENLAWGTSYIGFNATRNNGNWTCSGDGANNGGSILWGNVQGDIFVATVPRNSANTQTLTDTQVKSNIKLHLTAAGTLKAKEVQVTSNGWPDFVFDNDYHLPALSEVAQFITENRHLPNVPTAAEVQENGINLGEMNAVLLNKIEELMLYTIEQQKLIEDLQKRFSEFENKKGGEK